MTIHALCVRLDMLVVTWTDATTSHFPTIWLRDNCPSGLHPQTHERFLDLLSLDETPVLLSAQMEGETAVLEYADGHQSRIPSALLNTHRPGTREPDPAAIPPQFWRSEHSVARFAAGPILADDDALKTWMQTTAENGLSIVEGLDDRTSAGTNIAERIGFLRETNFGTTFEVMNKPDPNNLAYTPLALPMHTDLPNLELAPGYQFLHCLANEATGGESIFADGFAMAEDLRREDPESLPLAVRRPYPLPVP